MSTEYTYAVARIRAKELSLLTRQDLDVLLSAKDYDDCIRYLLDKGWGEEGKPTTASELLTSETEKLWSLMKELVGESDVFSVFTVQNDFHNLKASVKAVIRNTDPADMFINNGSETPERIYTAVKAKEYSALPEYLEGCAKTAMTALLQTGDGQLCDIIIDKACLETVYGIGRKSDNEIIRLYTELFVASADIKIAVRCSKIEKSLEFIKKCLADCESINTDLLSKAAVKSLDDIYSYLSFTDYSGAVDALKKSPAEFEKWCDNLLIEKMQTQKWEPFTVGPLAAYIIARENEIKAVRIILSAKLNDLDTEIVKERLRDMYV